MHRAKGARPKVIRVGSHRMANNNLDAVGPLSCVRSVSSLAQDSRRDLRVDMHFNVMSEEQMMDRSETQNYRDKNHCK